MPVTATEWVLVRNGKVASLNPSKTNPLRAEDGVTCEVVSYNGDRRPLRVGDKLGESVEAPGEYVRVGDGEHL